MSENVLRVQLDAAHNSLKLANAEVARLRRELSIVREMSHAVFSHDPPERSSNDCDLSEGYHEKAAQKFLMMLCGRAGEKL